MNPAPLTRLTHAVLLQAQDDAIRQLARGRRPNLTPWVETLVQAATPMIALAVRHGEKAKARELIAAIGKRRWGVRKKSLGQIQIAFDLVNPWIGEFIRDTTFNFARSTLETAATEAWKAYQGLRAELKAGTFEGDTAQEINRRMFGIFADPAKAARIGQTETMRSVNGGAYMLAEHTGVTNAVRWLASSDACPRCLALNGQVRKHGKPFYVDPKGGPYSVVLHPPLHPGCFCTQTDVLETNIPEQAVRQLHAVAYNRT